MKNAFLHFFRIILLIYFLACAAMASEIVPTPDQRPQLSPDIATDEAGTFLLVWQQGRLVYEQEEGDIYAIRISSSGVLLDNKPIPISTAVGTQERPRVSYSEGIFLVVWEDFRHGQVDVYAARIDIGGKLLDPNGIRITDRSSSQAWPVVANMPGGFVVLWQDSESGRFQVNSGVVTIDGTISAINGTALSFNGKPLIGGQIDLVSAGPTHFFQIRTDGEWRASSQRLTRKVGELDMRSGQADILSLAALPDGMYTEFPGRVAANSTRRMLTTGGVSRSVSAARAVFFEGLTPIPNPNIEPRPGPYDQGFVTQFSEIGLGPYDTIATSNEFGVALRRQGNVRSSEVPKILLYRFDLNGRLLHSLNDAFVIEEIDGYAPAINETQGNYLVAYEVSNSDAPTSIRFRLISPARTEALKNIAQNPDLTSKLDQLNLTGRTLK